MRRTMESQSQSLVAQNARRAPPVGLLARTPSWKLPRSSEAVYPQAWGIASGASAGQMLRARKTQGLASGAHWVCR